MFVEKVWNMESLNRDFVYVKFKFKYEDNVIVKMVPKKEFEELKDAFTIEFCETINWHGLLNQQSLACGYTLKEKINSFYLAICSRMYFTASFTESKPSILTRFLRSKYWSENFSATSPEFFIAAIGFLCI